MGLRRSGSLAGVRNEADVKLLSEKQHQIADLQNQLKSLVGLFRMLASPLLGRSLDIHLCFVNGAV